MTEFQHQAMLFKWAMQASVRAKYPCLKLLFHIPNGGRRDKIEAMNLKRAGVKSGVPDLCLPVKAKGYNSLYIEMKDDKGTESKEQIWWGEELAKKGSLYRCCNGWKKAVEVIEEYLEGVEI